MSTTKKAIKAGAGWKKTLPSGKTLINLTIENKRYVMWDNGYKTEEKQPDFIIYEDDYKPGGAATTNDEGLPF